MRGSLDSLENIDLGAAATAFRAGGGQAAEKKDGGVPEDVDLQAAGAAIDFQGVLAMIRGLTFEVMHPELVTTPVAPFESPPSMPGPESADGETQVPVSDEELPDWLKPVESVAPQAETEPVLEESAGPAPFPEKQEPEMPSGPTAAEAWAGLAAAGPGTQVIRDVEVVIPPAGVEKKRWNDVKLGLSSYLEAHWKEMAERGVGVAVGAVLGKLVEGSPWVQAGLGMALIATSVRSRIMDNSGRIGRFIELRKNLHPEFYRSKNVIRRGISLVVEAEMRSLQGAFWLTERPVTEGIGWGLALQGVMDGLTPDHPAQPQISGAAGGGEGGGATGGLPPDERGGGAAEGGEVQPPPETVVPQLPQVPIDAGEAQLQAAQAAEERAAEAVRQAALEAATRVHAVSPNETLSAIVARYGGDPYGIDMTQTILQSAGELTSGTDLAGSVRPGAEAAAGLVEYLKTNPTATWQQAINEGLKTGSGESVAKLFADATRMIYPNKLFNVVVGAAGP